MKIEDQVCSLELAKKLKEFGVKQESLFSWIYTDAPLDDGSRDKVVLTHTLGESHWELGGEQDTYSAFTVAELGEMLPGNISGLYFVTQKGLMGNSWYVEALTVVGHSEVWLAIAKTEADARAKCLIYLIENKLITL